MDVRWLAAAAALFCASCRVDCRDATDCGRGERCADDGTCARLPEAVPLGAISPGATMEAVAVYPAPGARQAPARTPIVVLTTRVVDPATVDAASFALEDTRRQPVPGTHDWLLEPPGFLYLPAAPLVPGASYNVRVTTGVRDGAGTPLRLPVSWTFTVATP
jgi:hypothetical protein